MEMMRQCWQWMMSLGWVGMAFGIILLALLIVLAVLLIGYVWRASKPR